MKALTEKIESAIQDIINGYSTQYIKHTDDNDNSWTIRVSNHMANPSRVSENFISLVIDAPLNLNTEDGWSINEKSFRPIANQFFLDESGDFTDSFESIEDMLNYVIE